MKQPLRVSSGADLLTERRKQEREDAELRFKNLIDSILHISKSNVKLNNVKISIDESGIYQIRLFFIFSFNNEIGN